MHGLQCHLSQPQAHDGIQHLLPVLPRALAALDVAPERDASRVATSPLALEGAPNLALDGTERRRQRPQEALAHMEHDSGKKKAHTDNWLRVLQIGLSYCSVWRNLIQEVESTSCKRGQ
jgi:hypothetical protein